MNNAPIGYIYEVRCLVNGKSYIGLRHYHKDKGLPWEHYLGSGKLIKAAIKKHGRESFIKTLLAEATSEDELQELEWHFIKEAKEHGRAQYNLFTGKGAGGDTFAKLSEKTVDEIRKRQSEGVRRHWRENREHMNAKNLQEQEDFHKKHAATIRESYVRTGSVLATANELGLSVKRVRRVIETLTMPVLPVHEKPRNIRESFGNYEAVSRALREKPMKNGKTSRETHDELLSRWDELMKLRESLKRAELEEMLNVTHTWLNRFFREHGVSRKNKAGNITCPYCSQ